MGLKEDHRDWQQWRYDALREAGCDPEAAVLLAESQEVDLHQAVIMLNDGCSVDLLLKILL